MNLSKDLTKGIRQGRVRAMGVALVLTNGEIRWQFETGPPVVEPVPVSKILDGLNELEADIRKWRRDVWGTESKK